MCHCANCNNWSTSANNWATATGSRTVYVAASSRDMRLRADTENCSRVWHWSADGRQILYQPAEQDGNRRVAVRDLSSGRSFDLLTHPKYNLAEAHLSPDDPWVVFHTIAGPVRRQLFVAPFRPGRAAGASDWIPIRDTGFLDRNAACSPDGKLLYFLSKWDGFRCIWVRRFDPVAKIPRGTMVPVYHFHGARYPSFASMQPGPFDNRQGASLLRAAVCPARPARL